MEGKWGAQVLSQLIAIFTEETPEETVNTAVDKLLNFCTQPAKPENINDTVRGRETYNIPASGDVLISILL